MGLLRKGSQRKSDGDVEGSWPAGGLESSLSHNENVFTQTVSIKH